MEDGDISSPRTPNLTRVGTFWKRRKFVRRKGHENRGTFWFMVPTVQRFAAKKAPDTWEGLADLADSTYNLATSGPGTSRGCT